jgi:threonine/homoserine/homoserine lactone efflux protein
MPLETYVAFALATTVLMLMPGPNATLIMSNSIARGARVGLFTVLGGSVAISLHMLLVCVGLVSLMAALGHWMEWVRWAGVAYLLWLGWRAWTAGSAEETAAPTARDARRGFWQGFMVATTNPKLLLFYAAFFPQFVSLEAAPWTQLLLLCVSFVAIQITCDSAYAFLAGRLAHRLRGPRGVRWRQKLTGVFLIGTGIGLAMARRS